MNGVFHRRRVIRQRIVLEDATSRFVVVIIPTYRRVVFLDRRLVEFHARLFLNPSFKLRVSWTRGSQISQGSFPIEPEIAQRHLIKSFPATWIPGIQLA